MPLDVSALTTSLQAAFSLGVVEPPNNAGSEEIALAIAAAYNTYALAAISCAASPPTVVNLTGLQNGLVDSIESETEAQAAQAWADAFEAFWTGALFGAGTVAVIGGTAALKQNLENVIFANKAATLQSGSAAIAQELDSFTKLVTVVDATIPCGPSPIS